MSNSLKPAVKTVFSVSLLLFVSVVGHGALEADRGL